MAYNYEIFEQVRKNFKKEIQEIFGRYPEMPIKEGIQALIDRRIKLSDCFNFNNKLF